ncbi:MAG: hypothetical protein ACOCRO_00835 [Halanaerobiales bacterium]
MAKPKWLLKPIIFQETEFGFRRSGEGMIFNYDKGNKHSQVRIEYFILNYNSKNNPYFGFYESFLSLDQIRRNVEINNDFSNFFKHEAIKAIFYENRENIEILKKAIYGHRV